MSLESATYIHQLVTANPEQDDQRSEGDNHLRMIKAAIQATFPNIAGIVTASHTELNLLAGVTDLPNVVKYALTLTFASALAAGAAISFTETATGATATDSAFPMPGADWATYPGLLITSWRPATDQLIVTVVNTGSTEIPISTELDLDVAVLA
jgi:hypothetical protein